MTWAAPAEAGSGWGDGRAGSDAMMFDSPNGGGVRFRDKRIPFMKVTTTGCPLRLPLPEFDYEVNKDGYIAQNRFSVYVCVSGDVLFVHGGRNCKQIFAHQWIYDVHVKYQMADRIAEFSCIGHLSSVEGKRGIVGYDVLMHNEYMYTDAYSIYIRFTLEQQEIAQFKGCNHGTSHNPYSVEGRTSLDMYVLYK